MRASEFIIETIDPDILHPDYKFNQKIGGLTYTASSYKAKSGTPILKIQVSDKIGEVAHTYFRVVRDQDGYYLESLNTYVTDEFQKKGIASTMYAIAKMLGNDIKPSSTQLAPGRSMWKAWRKSGDAKHLTK
jgi:hypothetical protein